MRNRKAVIFIFVLGVAIAGMAVACRRSDGSTNSANANNQPPTVDVTTAAAIVKPIPTYFEATGNLASDAQTDVAPAVAGKIVQVNFDVGSYVQKGDVLIRLDDRDARIRLEQNQSQMQQSQAAVGQYQAQVEQAQANVRQALAQLGLGENEKFSIAQVAEVRNAKAALDLAEAEYNRSARLLETGDISRSQFDQRKAQRDQARSAYQTALNGANQRFAAIRTATAQVQTAQAAVKAAQAAVGAAQAQVNSALKGVNDAAVLAPITGYISERVADVGEYISPNTPNSKIATILRTSTLRMKIDVPEQSIGKIATGQSISLQTTAYPDRNFAGTVARISPSLVAAARTMTVEADVPNSEGLLKPGQFATVRIAQSKPEPAVMIPAVAVRTDGDVSRVYVIKDGAAHEKLVQLGLLEDDMIQIKQGLVEGDVVATSNINVLIDGILVRQ
ncbi:MAG TPA: efflux RND transporter periplasmic adaptor subunit [Pyrinomonadaceae bacterium]|nr:efflux RND transporter periplasmic adaptor subunit [Pyrinomonadaceae bacterium]